MINVTFVCLGNICRSPMAEGVFQNLVKQAGLEDQIAVDSAGTSGFHVGEDPHRGTQRILKEKGISYEGKARQVSQRDFEEADYLITMDKSNLENVKKMGDTDAEIALLLDFASNADVDEVPDPYYTGNFERVYRLVTDGSEGLLAHIQEQHNL